VERALELFPAVGGGAKFQVTPLKCIAAVQLILPPCTGCAISRIVDLDPPTPAGVLGDEAFPPTAITGHFVNTTPADLS